MQEIFKLDPSFWQKNTVIIENLSKSHPSLFIAENTIENSKLFLNFLKAQPA